MEENPPPLEPQFHFSTHFFSKLTENGGMNHRNVRRWTRRVDLFRKSLVTIPIEYRKHWSLIIVANLDMIGRSDAGEFVPGIFAIDPLGTHEKGFVRIIREYLTAEWNQKKSWRACPIDLSKLPVHYPHATRQNDGDDCGVYSGVVYLTTAISIGRLKPGFSFFMSEEDAAVVEFAPGEFSRAGIVRIRWEINDLMTKLATEYHADDARSAISTAVPADNDGEVGAEPGICDDASDVAMPHPTAADDDAEVGAEPDIRNDDDGMAELNDADVDVELGVEPDIRNDDGGMAELNDADVDVKVDVEPDIRNDDGGMAELNDEPNAPTAGNDDVAIGPDINDDVSDNATRVHETIVHVFRI
jgi:hypothetical protein